MKIKNVLFILVQLLIVNQLFAQQFYKATQFRGDGFVDESTYIGGEEKFLDTITGAMVTKVNIVTEKNYIRYFFVDSIYWYDTLFVNDYLEGFTTIYDYLDDSLLVFYQQQLADDYDAASIVDDKIYEEYSYIDSLRGNKVMQFSLKEQKSLKEQEVIAYFIYDSMSWKNIRELPLRPFVKQEIDTLGVFSSEYLREIAAPMTYQEILDTINLFRNYAIDSVSSREFDPYKYLAELTRLQFMFPYYKKNIQKAYVREAVLNQMIKMSSKRINELRRFTGYDLKREPAFNNIITYKNVSGFNPRCVNLDTIPYYYYDEYDSVRVKMVQINPKGIVNVQFNQIQIESLKAAAKNLAFELDKWYKSNWERIYGIKKLGPGEFAPVDNN